MADRELDRNVVADVELAEKGPDFERRIGQPVEHRRAAPPELADDDLHIERKDLGDESTTFIAKATPSRPDWPDFHAGQLRGPARSRAACRGGTGTSGDGLRTASSSP